MLDESIKVTSSADKKLSASWVLGTNTPEALGSIALINGI